MMDKRRCRICLGVIFALSVSGLIYFGYYCPERVCVLTAGPPTPPYRPLQTLSLTDPAPSQTLYDSYVEGRTLHQQFDESSLYRDYDFNVDGEDVMVFLHIQKTGGTSFGRHLVKNIELDKPCQCYRGQKRCDCFNRNHHVWLFSRFSVGWPCGLHADWTELKNCVHQHLERKEGDKRKRRYYYITILREPLHRYLSEWKHIQRGATWLGARLKCNGRQATLEEVPFCFSGDDWSGVTLEEFMTCPHNLAINRQTRMLANLSLVHCYNRTAMTEEERNRVMLQSAKDNLRDMAFFGLTEYQHETQYIFERTFKMDFIEDFVQLNRTHAKKTDVTEEQLVQIENQNALDVELYKYAQDLFFQRLHKLKAEDSGNGRTSLTGDPQGIDDSHHSAVKRRSTAQNNVQKQEEEILREESENDKYNEEDEDYDNKRYPRQIRHS